MFARTFLGVFATFVVIAPAVRAIVNTNGTFQEDVLCELRDGVLGKQCDSESCSSPGNCKPRCCELSRPQPPQDPAVGQRSREACREYTPTNNADCGYVSNKQSVVARIGEFPYLVALGYKLKDNDTEYRWLCAGSLISENFVLTVATCITGARRPPELALLGSVHPVRDANSAEAPLTQRIPIAATIVHPEWSSERGKRGSDIALVRLAQAARFTNAVRPACLFTGRNPPFERATIAGFGIQGFGIQEEGNENLNKVIKVDVPIASKDECDTFLSTSVPNGDVNGTTVLCAGERGKDSCRGDSGAPLVIKSATPLCGYQILGLTAFGTTPCGSDIPSAYTRVHPYLPWIELIVWS